MKPGCTAARRASVLAAADMHAQYMRGPHEHAVVSSHHQEVKSCLMGLAPAGSHLKPRPVPSGVACSWWPGAPALREGLSTCCACLSPCRSAPLPVLLQAFGGTGCQYVAQKLKQVCWHLGTCSLPDGGCLHIAILLQLSQASSTCRSVGPACTFMLVHVLVITAAHCSSLPSLRAAIHLSSATPQNISLPDPGPVFQHSSCTWQIRAQTPLLSVHRLLHPLQGGLHHWRRPCWRACPSSCPRADSPG